jgi:hypothetical protein
VRLHRLLGPAPPADTQAAKSISWRTGAPDLSAAKPSLPSSGSAVDPAAFPHADKPVLIFLVIFAFLLKVKIAFFCDTQMNRSID